MIVIHRRRTMPHTKNIMSTFVNNTHLMICNSTMIALKRIVNDIYVLCTERDMYSKYSSDGLLFINTSIPPLMSVGASIKVLRFTTI